VSAVDRVDVAGPERTGAGRAQPAAPAPVADLTRGMIEIRHVADRGDAQAAYDGLYAGHGIDNPVRHLEHLLDLIDARPGQRLLDVACGEAGLVRVARARGLTAQGVDLSPVALAAGRRGGLPTGVLAVADGQALPFPDRCFDRVTNIGSLEHYADPLAGVAEMARVLAPGGRAAILVPNTFGLRWSVLHAWRHGDVHDDGQPIQRYATRGQWQRLLEAGGLIVERVVGSENQDDLPASGRDIGVLLRHPSRLLIPLARWVPVDMASMLIFVCGRR